ncbi:hypothetical protein SB5439_04968 [Klebsiella variicola]|uniref:hypothetical protein n=1 Tax=Klebsiella variicola TaxID=244366 RepID=UPI00109C8C1F|nr:hypothetical protein [Klebsiella variicola]VGQ11578.1 hypothetical protein SB5439_04968 [Klebsiella variicola]
MENKNPPALLSTEGREALVTAFAAAAQIDEPAALNYLINDNWSHIAAMATFRIDLNAGTFKPSDAETIRAYAEKKRAQKTRELAAVSGMRAHAQAVNRLLVALQLEIRETGLRDPEANAALETLLKKTSARDFDLSERYDGLLFELTKEG